METLYHGSTQPVNRPLVDVGRRHLDFGPGFYLTPLRDQAERWARRMQLIRATGEAWVTIYALEREQLMAEGYRLLSFNAYDEAWLTFIMASRTGKEPWIGYDIIEGGVADDRVIDTIEDYIAGIITVSQALGQLEYTKPNRQVCLLNQTLADKHLAYTGSYVITEKTDKETDR